MKVREEESHTPSEPLPAIFWDVSCFFKHRPQSKSRIVSSGAEGNDCGLAGKAASEYGINVPMKHTTLRCYGPGRALILPLIMPFGEVDSQWTYHSDSTSPQISHPQKRISDVVLNFWHSFFFFFLTCSLMWQVIYMTLNHIKPFRAKPFCTKKLLYRSSVQAAYYDPYLHLLFIVIEDRIDGLSTLSRTFTQETSVHVPYETESLSSYLNFSYSSFVHTPNQTAIVSKLNTYIFYWYHDINKLRLFHIVCCFRSH